MLTDYYNRHQSDKQYEKVMFRSGKGLQSAELNEIQSLAFEQTKGVADALLKEGDRVADGQVIVQADQGTAQVEAGKVYLRGMVRDVPAATLYIAMDRSVDIGVWLTVETVTELEDSNLRDPASGTRNYNEPGAARQKYHCRWGQADDTSNEGDFFPVHKVDNGVVLVKQPPPQLDSVTVALARYDRESNGSYVVDGLRTVFLSQDAQFQRYSISEGKAHVDGLEIALRSAMRKAFDVNPTLQAVESEPHQFVGDNMKTMRVNLSHTPLAVVDKVNGALEKSVNVQRTVNITDPLPDSSVYSVISVTQGATSYVLDTDFELTNNTINWSKDGAEPASGSTYTVVYRYRADITPIDVDETGFSVSHLVENSALFIDYQWKLPRIDLVTIDPEGQIRRIEGFSHAWQPMAPNPPSGQLVLSKIDQSWFNSKTPQVTNLAVRVIPMAQLETMQKQIADLYDLVAIERLRNDANLTEPVAKKGVFVDPFLDNDLRDQGIAQTAAIIDGELVLPIDGEIQQIGQSISSAQTLSYTLETVLEQNMKTSSMKVNPYQAFEPIPVEVILSPAQDRWTQSTTTWLDTITQRFVGARNRDQVRIFEQVQDLGTTSADAEFLRTRAVNFEIRGFVPNESLSELTFDDITLSAEQ